MAEDVMTDAEWVSLRGRMILKRENGLLKRKIKLLEARNQKLERDVSKLQKQLQSLIAAPQKRYDELVGARLKQLSEEMLTAWKPVFKAKSKMSLIQKRKPPARKR